MRLLSRSHNQEHGGFGVLTYNRYARARGVLVSQARMLYVADAHLDDGKRFNVRADELLTAFLKLQRAICIHLLTEQV